MAMISSSNKKGQDSKRQKQKQKTKFYWDVVLEEKKVEISGREKMTKAKARHLLNFSDDEMTQKTVYNAWRRLSYPLELQDNRGKNENGHSLVDYHEAYQHLSKYAKSAEIFSDKDEENTNQQDIN